MASLLILTNFSASYVYLVWQLCMKHHVQTDEPEDTGHRVMVKIMTKTMCSALYTKVAIPRNFFFFQIRSTSCKVTLTYAYYH